MRGANGILLVAVGLIVIWAIASGAGPCLGGALQCLLTGSTATKTPTTTSVAAPSPVVAK